MTGRIFRSLTSLINATNFGRHVCASAERLYNLTALSKKSKFEVQCYRSLLVALAVDIILGLVCWHYLIVWSFTKYVPKYTLFIKEVASNLEVLLDWLMGVPVGLKLNYPLSEALGRFFLYHIHLWTTYTNAIQPVIEFLLKMLPFVGCLGISTQISLLNDMIFIATVHIYCFYGYATRLYGIQVKILASLWRLFRGKKWNPLRKRVDTYHYDNQQLFLGTLFFTILLFLLPTVSIYYLTFTLLHLVVLVPVSLLLKASKVICTFPSYLLLLHLLRVPTLPGEVEINASVFSPNEPKVLSINRHNPDLEKLLSEYKLLSAKLSQDSVFITEAKKFTAIDFLHCLLSGKLISPY